MTITDEDLNEIEAPAERGRAAGELLISLLPRDVLYLISRLEAAEADNARLREFERHTVSEGMLDASRYWEGRYRDEAAENARLRAALAEAVDRYGQPGGPWNVPSDPGGWLSRAREALKDRP